MGGRDTSYLLFNPNLSSSYLCQQQVRKKEEEHQAVVAQWGVLEQVLSFLNTHHPYLYIHTVHN